MDRTDKKKLPLSFFPGGTGNAFVRDIDFLDTKKALSRTLENKKRKIDIFLCKTQKKQFYSFNIVGWGIPSDINILAEKLRFLGGMRYNVASLIEVFKKKQRFANLQFNDNTMKDNFGFIMACNTIHTGKGMKIAPFAKLDDGLIDLLVVRNVKRLKLLSLFTKIFNGDHIKDAKVEYFTTRQLNIKSEKEYPLNIDGDNKETSPITIQVLPKEIEIFN